MKNVASDFGSDFGSKEPFVNTVKKHRAAHDELPIPTRIARPRLDIRPAAIVVLYICLAAFFGCFDLLKIV